MTFLVFITLTKAKGTILDCKLFIMANLKPKYHTFKLLYKLKLASN